MKLDILAFGAHPDDVELSCSGTILKNVALGKRVGIIDLTRGELGTRGTVAIRLKEATNASKILGVLFRENLKMADGFFQNDKKHLLAVIKKIRQYKPDVVLANSLEDRHPDHGRSAKLVADACFLAGLVKIKTTQRTQPPLPSKGGFARAGSPPSGGWGAGFQEPWRPKALYHYIQYRKLRPDFAVDITPFMKKRMKAIKAFKSQFFNPASKDPKTLISDPQFLDYVISREEEYGKLINVTYAEGFNVKEEYKGEILI
ncbi:MAG: bacillithiol biosynthesis deacetylase BshB1 [Bacteroidetes bacterium]|nr:MAG: bacillithiol biosynthesis deacetylase BshB1 [Bacteroidota bacterium]